MTPEQTLAVARILVRKHAPYLATAVLSLIPRKMPGLETMGVTERGVLYWDPEWVAQLGPEKTMGVLLHEVSHIIRDHAGRHRRMGADPKLWNVAADMEINDDLKAMKIPLPAEGVFPEDHGQQPGGLAETYYHALKEQQSKGQEPKTPDKPTACGGWDGSGGGRPLPNEPSGGPGPANANGDGPGGKAEAPSPGRSEADLARVRNQTAEAVRNHERQHGQGSVPGGWHVWADEHLKPPKIRWQDKLARAIRGSVAYTAGSTDYTYSRPSRRQAMYAGCESIPVIPSTHSPLPTVAVGLDTSGSMGGSAIERAAAEINGILKATKAAVQFIACDSQVQEVRKLKSSKEFKDAFKGGGGTSFVPVFEKLQELQPRPTSFVFITDGAGDGPANPPHGVDVIWVICGDYRSRPYARETGQPIEWGSFVEIDD